MKYCKMKNAVRCTSDAPFRDEAICCGVYKLLDLQGVGVAMEGFVSS